jgi:hypothetical protein
LRWQGIAKPSLRQCVTDANGIAKAYNPQAIDPITKQQPMDWAKDIFISGYDQITFQMGNYK